MFSSDTATVRHSLVLSKHIHVMSVFSAVKLRQYDTTTVPCPKYPYAYVCVFSSDTATLRHHPLLYMVSLFFLQRHCDTTTVRHHPLLNIVNLFFLQRHYDSTTQHLKEAYSILCMKIHLTSKITKYITNIFKMRFLMRNCSKYAQQCQNGIFEKTCRATTVP